MKKCNFPDLSSFSIQLPLAWVLHNILHSHGSLILFSITLSASILSWQKPHISNIKPSFYGLRLLTHFFHCLSQFSLFSLNTHSSNLPSPFHSISFFCSSFLSSKSYFTSFSWPCMLLSSFTMTFLAFFSQLSPCSILWAWMARHYSFSFELDPSYLEELPYFTLE